MELVGLPMVPRTEGRAFEDYDALLALNPLGGGHDHDRMRLSPGPVSRLKQKAEK